ncbi:ABC transporter substrate-binding protein [Mycolicibacterium sp.]|uniref:ABC transporter substrate-binding protein n=1 Tax=Mycolicibacterium sp. TaxID=2320850 RepID=UPI0037C8C903
MAEPTGLDPVLVFDADSSRINAQIFETLTTLKEGTASEVVPGLATSWSPNADSTVWTFTLRSGVKFQDGTVFDAAAVKYNFERWRNLPPQLQGRAELYGSVFGGFGDAGIVRSVDTPDPTTFILTLSEPRPDLPIALTVPVFSIASPDALTKYGSDAADANGASEFATAHPVGTGPFKFDTWVRGDRIELVRNDTYWGVKTHLDRLVFKALPDAAARLNAVQAGDVDIADMISPRDSDAVEDDPRLQLLTRGSCNSGYVAFKSNQAPFNDPLVREAVGHAINKSAIIDRFYGKAGTPGWLLMPDTIAGYDKSLADPTYDPDLARKLLAKSSTPNPAVEFWYPTDVTRPWLPDSQGIFQAITADLEAVGFKITPRSATWTAYLKDSQSPAYGMFLLGWSCDYGAPNNFYGGAFGYINGKPNPRYEYASAEFTAALAAAQATPADRQEDAWARVQSTVYKDNPVIPFVHGASLVAARSTVGGYTPSPVMVEHFAGTWVAS